MDHIPINAVGAMDVAALSMRGDLERLESITQNMVNVSTPAYKRQITVEHAFSTALAEATSNGTQGIEGLSVPIESTLRDMSSGGLRHTGSPMDVALSPSTFLEIETEKGTRYTRAGNLQLDHTGKLVSAQGDTVVGTAGEISADGSDLTIQSNGTMVQRGKTIGQLKLVQFDHAEK